MCTSLAASMPSQNHILDQTYVPLGQRRGQSDLARFSLDLTWGRADTECSAHARAYPSPPMSGSPPPPPKPTHEAGDRIQGGQQGTSHEIYRMSTSVPGSEYRVPLAQPTLGPESPASGLRPLPPVEAQPYGFRRSEDIMGRPLSFGRPADQIHPPQPQYQLPPMAGASQVPHYAMTGTSQQVLENLPYNTSPKSRKPKGHVASACVPCKRAHLR